MVQKSGQKPRSRRQNLAWSQVLLGEPNVSNIFKLKIFIFSRFPTICILPLSYPGHPKLLPAPEDILVYDLEL